MTDEKVISAINSTVREVVYTFHKRFHFDLGELRKLRDLSDRALEMVRERERKHFHSVLRVPAEYEGTPSFVSASDPTRGPEGGDINYFDIHACMSPERAFEIGFDSIAGAVLLDREYSSGSTKFDKWGAVSVHKSKKEGAFWDLTLRNSRYDAAIHGTVAFQIAVGNGLKSVKKKLEAALE